MNTMIVCILCTDVSHLATSWSALVGCTALHLILIAEEVRVALVTEGQAQNSLGVCHRVALAVSHLAATMPRHVTTHKFHQTP